MAKFPTLQVVDNSGEGLIQKDEIQAHRRREQVARDYFVFFGNIG